MQPADLHAEEGEASLRCLFLAEESYKDAGSRKFVESLGQQLHSKGGNVRKQAHQQGSDRSGPVGSCEVHQK